MQLPLYRGEERLSVFAPVEELVACLEVSLSAIAPSSLLSPERACCPGNQVKWLY